MKRFGIYVIIAIFAGSALSSCATMKELTKITHYSYEFNRISKAHYDAAKIPSEITFDTVSAYYKSLKSQSVENETGTVTKAELREYLKERNTPGIESNLKLLDSRGNNLFTFFTENENEYIILYCEKIEKE